MRTTKTERVSRAREVRRHVSWFIDLQETYIRDMLPEPDSRAMSHLLAAHKELTELINTLRTGKGTRG